MPSVLLSSPYRIAAGIGAAAVLATALTACGGGSSSPSADAGPAQPGGTLRYGLSQAPTCADPAQSGTNQTIYVARQVVDSLTDQDPATGELKPWLAESWETDADASSFTFHLKEGVTFSDGTPFTAESVKKNLDAIVNALSGAKAPLGASYLAGYTGTTVIDPLTAQVDFAAPNAQFLQASSTPQLGILSDASVVRSAEERCTGNISGTGPFTYADYQQDKSVTLAKRAGYNWGSDVFGHDGEAYLDTIEFSVVPESGVRTGSLSSGQLDAISDALPQDAPRRSKARAAGAHHVEPPGTPPFGFQPNVTRGPLVDPPVVRSALVPAINRQELVDTVLGPNFTPATSTLASRTPRLRVAAGRDVRPGEGEVDSGSGGLGSGADGIREKGGQKLSFPRSVQLGVRRQPGHSRTGAAAAQRGGSGSAAESRVHS